MRFNEIGHSCVVVELEMLEGDQQTIVLGREIINYCNFFKVIFFLQFHFIFHFLLTAVSVDCCPTMTLPHILVRRRLSLAFFSTIRIQFHRHA